MGDNGTDTLTTGSGNDSLLGEANSDSLSAGAGADTVDGGANSDPLVDGGNDTDVIELTRVHADVPGDTVLPAGWLAGFTLVSEEPGPSTEEHRYTWLRYERI